MDYCVSLDCYNISSNLDKNNKSYIYGEVNPKDIINIIKQFNYENCSLLDVGSGCGKIIISIANELQLFCTSVEIDNFRFNKSLELLNDLEINGCVEILNKDFKDIYFGSYDFIYCCNTIFEKEDNKNLYNKILKEFNGYLFFFNYDSKLKKYLIYEKNIKSSWSQNVILYVFFIY